MEIVLIPSTAHFIAYAIVIAIVFLLVQYLLRSMDGLSHPLPPGPKGMLFVGNALQLPAEYQERMLYFWGKAFGTLRCIVMFLMILTFYCRRRRSCQIVPHICHHRKFVASGTRSHGQKGSELLG